MLTYILAGCLGLNLTRYEFLLEIRPLFMKPTLRSIEKICVITVLLDRTAEYTLELRQKLESQLDAFDFLLTVPYLFSGHEQMGLLPTYLDCFMDFWDYQPNPRLCGTPK